MTTTAIVRALLVGTLLVGAGCLGTGPGTPTESPAPASPTETSSPDPPFTEPHSPSDGDGGTPSISAVDQAAPAKAVILENRWNRSVDIQVRVYRNATNEVVHDEKHVVAPGAEREVYDTATANPEGIETFSIRFSARNTTEQFSIETNACYGNAYGEIQDDGTLYAYHAIC